MKKNANGFTLIGTLIAAGVVASVALILATLMENSFKSSNTSQVDMDLITIKRTLDEILLTPLACRATFGKMIRGTDDTLREGFQPNSKVNIIERNGLGEFKGKTNAGVLMDRFRRPFWTRDEFLTRDLQLVGVVIPKFLNSSSKQKVFNFLPILPNKNYGIMQVHFNLKPYGSALKSFLAKEITLKYDLFVNIYDYESKKHSLNDYRILNCSFIGIQSLEEDNAALAFFNAELIEVDSSISPMLKSKNISRIEKKLSTPSATPFYRIHFQRPMPDNDYAVVGSASAMNQKGKATLMGYGGEYETLEKTRNHVDIVIGFNNHQAPREVSIAIFY